MHGALARELRAFALLMLACGVLVGAGYAIVSRFAHNGGSGTLDTMIVVLITAILGVLPLAIGVRRLVARTRDRSTERHARTVRRLAPLIGLSCALVGCAVGALVMLPILA